jgi:hypothetical protein
MSRRDPPRGVSPLVFVAALALGVSLLLPSLSLGGERPQASGDPATCPPAAAGSR